MKRFFKYFLLIAVLVQININLKAQQPTVIFDPAQYPGYPVKTIYIPAINSGKDSIPLHLIQAVQSADILSPFVSPPTLYWYGEGQPYLYCWGEQYPPYVLDLVLPAGIFSVWLVPACGDSFYENGQLSSSVECVDSVMHGKAIYWDETGHKTSESTYSEGHQIKQKIYDNRGRITSVTHYDYQGQYHGICIYYNYYEESNTKSVSRYHHGVLEGLQEEFSNGILTTKTNYKSGEAISEQSFYADGKLKRSLIKANGHVLSDIELNSNGDTVFYQKGNESGQMEFVRRWYDDGTIYQDCKYVNGIPYGTWLLGYNPQTGVFQKEIYDSGLKVLSLHGTEEFLYNRTAYLNGKTSEQTLKNEKGDTTSHTIFHPDGTIAYQKKWNERGNVQHEYTAENDSVFYLLSGSGYYILYDTLYSYTAENKPWNHYVSRYVIWKDDTLRKEYCMNQGAPNEYQHILAKNFFAQTDHGSLKNGEWKYYSNNILDSVITYKNGIRNGRAVYYQAMNDSVLVQSYGFYGNDLKQGEWNLFYSPLHFDANPLQRSEKLEIAGRESAILTYSNNILNGACKYFDAAGNIKTDGNFENGTAAGIWVYYDDNGIVIKKVNYKRDSKEKKKIDFLAVK